MSGPGPTPAPATRTVRVALGAGYDVVIGPGVLGASGGPSLREGLVGFLASHKPTKAAILVDQRLESVYAPRLTQALQAAGVESFVVPLLAAESAKTLDAAREALVAIAQHKMDRAGLVIALGGGVIGDLAGFCAATYRRGVAFVQCPTTLLAMVDASVGGKTGVNLDIGDDDAPQVQKNFVGVFHQPKLVLADTDTLASLPDRDLRAGLAECIKHAMVAGSIPGVAWPDALAWTHALLPRVLAREAGATVELIARNVELKARVVEGDEREERAEGGRALLNLGHTFAHAIEPLGHLRPDNAPGPLMHGEAVALGLVAAAHTSAALGLCGADYAARVREVVKAAGLPDAIRNLPDATTLIERMGHDKKVLAHRLRIIVPRVNSHGQGVAEVVQSPDQAVLEAGWRSIRGDHPR